MTPAEIYNVVQAWAVSESGLAGEKVIPANENAPRPDFPYITILVTSTVEEEFATIGTPDEDGFADIENDMTCMVSVQSYGAGAKAIMATLRKSLNKVTVEQDFRAALLPFIRVESGVNDLTEQVTPTQFEERAGMDLEFRTVSVVNDNVGVIESTVISGTVEHDGEIEDVEIDIQIGV